MRRVREVVGEDHWVLGVEQDEDTSHLFPNCLMPTRGRLLPNQRLRPLDGVGINSRVSITDFVVIGFLSSLLSLLDPRLRRLMTSQLVS